MHCIVLISADLWRVGRPWQMCLFTVSAPLWSRTPQSNRYCRTFSSLYNYNAQIIHAPSKVNKWVLRDYSGVGTLSLRIVSSVPEV